MNIFRGKAMSRRAILKSSGAALAIPFLEAMTPASVSARVGRALPSRPNRLVCIEEVHGVPGCNQWGAEQHLFAPETVGRDYELVSENVLKGIEGWRDQFTIISNTDVRMAEAFSPGEIGGDHFRSSAVFLTQAHPKQTQGSDLLCGVSMDQIHAQRFGAETILPSLQLCIESNDKGGGCDYNYSCSYMDSISWSSPTSPLPMIRNPRTAFDMLFGAGGSVEERTRRRRTQSSILDWLVTEIADMQRELGASDRRRLESYLESVREIERRIQLVEAQNTNGDARALPGAPAGVPDSYSEHVRLMFDLQVLAFQTDMTRVVSFKLGRDASNRIFPECESTRPFHPASHHGDKKKKILEFNKICKFRMNQMDTFLKGLSESNDGDGSLLDHSMIVWGSPMGDANLHNHRRCPLVVFGGANGALKGGQHLKADDGTPMANVMLTLLQKLGHDRERFGDSTGAFDLG